MLTATAIAVVHPAYEPSLDAFPDHRMTIPLVELDFGQTVAFHLPIERILYCMAPGGVTALEFYQRYHEGHCRPRK